MCAVPSAPGAASVRVWHLMSRGRGPRTGPPPPEGVHVDNPPRLTKGTMTIFNGWEPSAFESFMAGADGWFAGMTNVIPRQCVELFDLAVEASPAQSRHLEI